MQAVITREDAKRITKGRTPLIPAEYEAAVKALAECLTFDEAKYWSDKASALAAWAKIYHSHDIGNYILNPLDKRKGVKYYSATG